MKRKQKIPQFTKKSFQKFLKDNPEIQKSMENTRELLAHPEKVQAVVDDIFSTPYMDAKLQEITNTINRLNKKR